MKTQLKYKVFNNFLCNTYTYFLRNLAQKVQKKKVGRFGLTRSYYIKHEKTF